MRQFLTRFIRNRRAAVALIFTGCLLPLTMLIGLSIDYSFYVQARSQFGLAADATAMYALREASAIYTIDTKTNGVDVATATTNAQKGGVTAGQAWFTAQLGALPTATNSNGSPAVQVSSATATVAGAADGCPAAGCAAAGFSAAVSYTGTYPPFFNTLFHRGTNWTITGTADATTTFNYLELLVLMDDSGSMLVSADQGSSTYANGTPTGAAISDSNPGTVATMDLNTVCIPNSWIDTTAAGYANAAINTTVTSSTSKGVTTYTAGSSTSTANYYEVSSTSTFVNWKYATYLYNTSTNSSSKLSTVALSSSTAFSVAPLCESGTNSFTNAPGVASGATSVANAPTTGSIGANKSPGLNAGGNLALAPCAFACHTATSTSYHYLTATTAAPLYTYVNQVLTPKTSGTYAYPNDLYGLARQLGVKLKIDTVFQSTEAMITTLSNAEQIPGQFTVGMYAFNGDACPIVNGLTDGSYNLPEATTDLNGALGTIEANDYTYTPTTSQTNPGETAFPPTAGTASGDTNFPLSVSDLIAGTMGKISSSGISSCSNTSKQAALATASATSTVGSIPSNPQKDVFIITDGVEDSYGPSYSATGSLGQCTNREAGEMTGITAEENGTTTVGCGTMAVCQQLKNLGFTVYVLYIPYPATQNPYYYQHQSGMPADPYMSTDANNSTTGISSSTFVTNGTTNLWNNGNSSTVSPDQQALTACASTTAGHSDFYTANSTADISTQMGQMLSSAMNSAIRITQ